jgi:large subunit ribosomal protein L9
MKVMLLKDVYKLGRAGEVKKVANGYGRNYLIPQGLAVLATPGALANAERIGSEADKRRAVLNEELSGLAGQLSGKTVTFPVRASETGKLYGSVTTRMIISAVNESLGTDLSHRQIDGQPIRTLGEFAFPVRLTIDLAPEIIVIVYREGEGLESAYDTVEEEIEDEEVEAVEMMMDEDETGGEAEADEMPAEAEEAEAAAEEEAAEEEEAEEAAEDAE